MLGAGTRTAITSGRDFPALLDITRLTSRVGRGPHSGVDRVELAYLKWGLATSAEFWGLAKIAGGYVLLDRAGMQAFYDRLTGTTSWGARDLRAVVGIKTPAPRGAAEADLRRIAKIHVKQAALSVHFKTFGDAGFVYLNVGHSNLSDRQIGLMKEAGIKVAIFLHDLIPLEHKCFHSAESVTAFEEKVTVATTRSDIVITNSQDTSDKIKADIKRRNGSCPVVWSHLGLTLPDSIEDEKHHNRPYFVTLGTIEPRKNHALLLDIWDQLLAELPQDSVPDLYIIGQRGWKNEDVITRLDGLKDHPKIHEHNDMDDSRLWSMVKGAHALLFPSHVEGFGLPSLEAAALGTPVICGDLAIHRELLGAYPVYASLQDLYLWKKTIIEQAGKELDDLRKACALNRPHLPTWDEHFTRINHAVMEAI